MNIENKKIYKTPFQTASEISGTAKKFNRYMRQPTQKNCETLRGNLNKQEKIQVNALEELLLTCLPKLPDLCNPFLRCLWWNLTILFKIHLEMKMAKHIQDSLAGQNRSRNPHLF